MRTARAVLEPHKRFCIKLFEFRRMLNFGEWDSNTKIAPQIFVED